MKTHNKGSRFFSPLFRGACFVCFGLTFALLRLFLLSAMAQGDDRVKPGRFNDYRRRTPSAQVAREPTPFHGRCTRDFDGKLICVKFPGKGENRCQTSSDCLPATPTSVAFITPTPTPSPSPTPSFSCLCACRVEDSSRELLCSAPFVYRISRLGNICPDREAGWYPWAFERDANAVPTDRDKGYCAKRWNGDITAGYSERSPRETAVKCTLEQCREGMLKRAWPQ